MFELRNADGVAVAQFDKESDELTVRSCIGGELTRREVLRLLPYRVFSISNDFLAAFLGVEEAWEFCHAITWADRTDEMESGFQLEVRLCGPSGFSKTFVGGQAQEEEAVS